MTVPMLLQVVLPVVVMAGGLGIVITVLLKPWLRDWSPILLMFGLGLFTMGTQGLTALIIPPGRARDITQAVVLLMALSFYLGAGLRFWRMRRGQRADELPGAAIGSGVYVATRNN